MIDGVEAVPGTVETEGEPLHLVPQKQSVDAVADGPGSAVGGRRSASTLAHRRALVRCPPRKRRGATRCPVCVPLHLGPWSPVPQEGLTKRSAGRPSPRGSRSVPAVLHAGAERDQRGGAPHRDLDHEVGNAHDPCCASCPRCRRALSVRLPDRAGPTGDLLQRDGDSLRGQPPLCGSSRGDRFAPKRYEGPPPGGGNSPRSAVFSADRERGATLAARFPDLLDRSPRAPIGEKRSLIVRLDGYVGLSTAADDWTAADWYFEGFAP